MIEELDDPAKKRIRDEWHDRGATYSDLSILDNAFERTKKWNAVVDDNSQTKCVFDVRQALQYAKNMEVIFAPDIQIDEDNVDYETAKPVIHETIDILAEILFSHLKDLASGNNKFFKIYSDHKEVRIIFYEFCQYLEDKFPDKYKLKIYGKWIEIHQKN